MAKDFGFIRADPKTGKWHWPYAQMRMGDFFRVSPVDREPRKVCAAAHSRSYQLGRKFSTATDAGGVVTVYCGTPHDRGRHDAQGMGFLCIAGGLNMQAPIKPKRATLAKPSERHLALLSPNGRAAYLDKLRRIAEIKKLLKD